mgnify:CR=1 FL=1
MAYLMTKKQKEETHLIYFKERDSSIKGLEQKCELFPQPYFMSYTQPILKLYGPQLHIISYIQPKLIVAGKDTTDKKTEKPKIYIPPKTDYQKRENRKNKRGRKHGRNKSHIKH